MTARQQRRAQQLLARKQDKRKAHILHEKPNSNNAAPVLADEILATQTSTNEQPEQRNPSLYANQIDTANIAILLPSEDAALYRKQLLHFFKQHSPEPGVESVIVQRLADLQWRLRRVAILEAGVMALGHRKHAELFTDSDPATRTALLDAHTLTVEASVFKQLHTQETRLRRYYATDLKELTVIQQNRQNQQTAASTPAQQSQPVFSESLAPKPLISDNLIDNEDDGFEFSNSYNLELGTELDPAACLQFMVGSEFSNAAMSTGTATAENRQ